MKYFFSLLFFLLYSGLIFSQQNNKRKYRITYTNTNNLELLSNTKNQFSTQKTAYNERFRFESDYDYKYVIGVYTKGKAYILNNQTYYKYTTLSVGISLGIRTN